MASRDQNFKKALRRYQAGVFTDADVTRCTGLSARSVRELIKQGAVRTRSEDRGAGRIRTFDSATFKRLAVVAAINDAGFGLKLAGQIAYLLPSDDLLYRTYDPIDVLFDTTVSVDRGRELPPRLEKPRFDWFDADKPAAADPKTDWLRKSMTAASWRRSPKRDAISRSMAIYERPAPSSSCWWPVPCATQQYFFDRCRCRPKVGGQAVTGRPDRSEVSRLPLRESCELR